MKYWVLLLLFWSLPLNAEFFLPGTEDIPLMDGIVQVEENAAFDDPEERMVFISGQTNLSATDVLRFYEKTLANLGWKKKKPYYFERGMDSLLIEIVPKGSKNLIQFQLKQLNN